MPQAAHLSLNLSDKWIFQATFRYMERNPLINRTVWTINKMGFKNNINIDCNTLLDTDLGIFNFRKEKY